MITRMWSVVIFTPARCWFKSQTGSLSFWRHPNRQIVSLGDNVLETAWPRLQGLGWHSSSPWKHLNPKRMTSAVFNPSVTPRSLPGSLALVPGCCRLSVCVEQSSPPWIQRRENETVSLCFFWYFLGSLQIKVGLCEQPLSCCLSPPQLWIIIRVCAFYLIFFILLPLQTWRLWFPWKSRCGARPKPISFSGALAEREEIEGVLRCDERSHSYLPMRKTETGLEELALIRFTMITDTTMTSLCRGRLLYIMCTYLDCTRPTKTRLTQFYSHVLSQST